MERGGVLAARMCRVFRKIRGVSSEDERLYMCGIVVPGTDKD